MPRLPVPDLPIAPPPDLAPYAPAARRELTVFGAPVELVHVPQRAQRRDRATDERPAFRRSPAARIVREEALWSTDGLVITPNPYPFGRDQRLLWSTSALREPDALFWAAAAGWAVQSGGTVMLNSIGAAASIARVHAHLLADRLPFLPNLVPRRSGLGLIDLPRDTTLWEVQVPFCLLAVSGPPAGLAAALVAIGDTRMTPAWNVVLHADTAWVYPRRVETPVPHFPHALGAAEIGGRWCYVDEAAFSTATTADLERALVIAGMPPLSPV